MFISSCPLRVSLFGGSTDNPVFVERYGYGSVISFACSLKTYITLHEDKLGYNNQGGKYIINYSKREEVTDVRKIKNEFSEKTLLESGLFYFDEKKKICVERFKGRLIFPINNISGQPIALGGRIIENLDYLVFLMIHANNH